MQHVSCVFLIASADSRQWFLVTCQMFLLIVFLAKSDVNIKISLLSHF